MTTLVRVKSWRSALAAAAMMVGAAMFGAPQTAQAVPISGSISITGDVIDPTSTTGVNFDGDGFVVGSASGDLSGIAAGTPVTLTDIVFAALPGTIWSVGGFSFSITALTSPAVVNGLGGINFAAIGVLSSVLPGLDPTTGSFNFTSNSLGSQASFSSVTAVPLPASLLLFGGGVAGLGMLAMRRRRKAGPAVARPGS